MSNLVATGGVPGPGRIGRVAIGDLLKRAARRFPDRIAVTDGARRVTFTEIERDANRFANYLVAQSFPVMASKLGLATSYTFYGICAVISFFLVQRFIHETKGKELEAMEG